MAAGTNLDPRVPFSTADYPGLLRAADLIGQLAARSELGKGHPERLSIRHSIVNFSVSGLIFGRGRRPKKPRRSGAAKWEETPSQRGPPFAS